MTFEEFVKHIGDVIGLEGMAPQKGEDGISCFYLEMPEDLMITFMEVPECGMVLTTSSVGALPLEHREQLMLEMLAANSKKDEIFGGTLSIDNEKEQVNICRYDSLDSFAPDNVKTLLECFINDVVTWHERLGRLYDENAEGERNTDDVKPSDDMFRIDG